MINKHPFVKQRGIKDCAAACTLMIIKYYKGYIGISKLEKMLHITKKGTNAYQIVETLKSLGFNAYGIKEQQLTTTKNPFIANVIIDGSYKHFIVVYEVNKKNILIADPATRVKKISYDEFYKIWTGINIIMYPVKPIINEQPKNLSRLFKILKIKKSSTFKIGLVSLIISILSLVISFFFQTLIENVNNDLIKIILIFIIIIIFQVFLIFYRNKLLIKITSSIDKKLTKEIFKNIIFLPYEFYHNHTTGEIISKINDINILKNVISKIILTCFIDLPLTIFSGIILFIINKKLFIIVMLSLFLYLLTIMFFYKKINIKIENNLNMKSDVNTFMTECFAGFETIQGNNIENKMIENFNHKYNKYIAGEIKLNKLINLQNLCKNYINAFMQFFVLIVGIMLVKNGTITIGLLITYNLLSTLFLDPVKNIIDLEEEIRKSIHVLNRAFDLTQNSSYLKEKVKGDIIIKNLNFAYEDHYCLKNINLNIKKGNKVLLMGASGSGKSTLLKLIKGYYNNYEGHILINNKEVNKVTNIVYISAKEIIFTGTIKYNLTLKGTNNLNIVINDCCLSEVIENNNLKENTLLEENGFNISAGQRQRLILARAVQKFEILLIDEGLNAIDVNLERKILKMLFQRYKTKTIICVSHRKDNLDLFDQYINLKNGKIILDTSLPQ